MQPQAQSQLPDLPQTDEHAREARTLATTATTGTQSTVAGITMTHCSSTQTVDHEFTDATKCKSVMPQTVESQPLLTADKHATARAT